MTPRDDPLAEARQLEQMDLAAVKARSDLAMHHEGERSGYVLAQRWYQSAADVPALLVELQVARELIEDVGLTHVLADAVAEGGRP